MHFESKKASSTHFPNLKSAHFFWAFFSNSLSMAKPEIILWWENGKITVYLYGWENC